MRQSLMAGASSFAHLLGRSAKVAKAADEDEDKKKSKHAAEDDDKRDDEKDDDQKDEKSKKAKAEEPDDERDDERDEDEDEGDAKKSKKAKAKRAKAEDDEGDDDEEGDDDSDGSDMRKKGASSARLRERARCRAIFADAAAGKNPALAAELSFGTDLPRTQAINVLRAGGLAVTTPRRPTLDERMAAVKVPTIGPDGGQPAGAAPDAATKVIAAGMKRRGEKPEAIEAFINSRR